MATMAAPSSQPVTPDTPITIKITVNDVTQKLKLPYRDLGISVLPNKLRQIFAIKPEQDVVLERYSDSVAGYVVLDEDNQQVFKTLMRAAKAKGKLRLKITFPVEQPKSNSETDVPAAASEPSMSVTHNMSEQRNLGSGIFQFREARASQATLANGGEAPVPAGFTVSPASLERSNSQKLAIRPKSQVVAPVAPVIDVLKHAWSVYCNACDKAMPNQHFHCSICDSGDYDLCEECVAQGKSCRGADHWLVKRFMQDGKVVTSTTERLPVRKSKAPANVDDTVREIPGAFNDETKTLTEDSRVPSTRTCNSCVAIHAEHFFVHCDTCEDFDLCIKCHGEDKHGHHPAHGFVRATEETVLPQSSEAKLAAGRDVRHNALCDGCDTSIRGIRHKCLSCPDWDYCNGCIKFAGQRHPGHRFAALFTPISDMTKTPVRHVGILCDGPLCERKPKLAKCITGVRYKCTICHDTDFCASCEAHPSNQHNHTHPLLKLKTPVRNVNVYTENGDKQGTVRVLGDRQPVPSVPAAPAAPVSQANSATPVQTVAEIKPEEAKAVTDTPSSVSKFPTFLLRPTTSASLNAVAATVPSSLLEAHFVGDVIEDGLVLAPEARFTQVWTMRNPGPYAWPAGCSVRFVGGDNQLDVDNKHSGSVASITSALESNVVAREVQVGEEVAFKVTLKAPVRQGTSISYWRLKAPDGTAFGHRLWCDIKVQKPRMAEPTRFESASMPSFQLPDGQHATTSFADQSHYRQESLTQMLDEQRKRQEVSKQQHLILEQTRMRLVNEQARQARELENLRNLNQQRMDAANKTDYIPPSRFTVPLAAPQLPYLGKHTDTGCSQQPFNGSSASSTPMQSFGFKYGAPAVPATYAPRYSPAMSPYASYQTVDIGQPKAQSEQICERLGEGTCDLSKSDSPFSQFATVPQNAAQPVEEVEAEEPEAKNESSIDDSRMIFPKLEKESPTSSTYQSMTESASKQVKAAYVENESGEVERDATLTQANSGKTTGITSFGSAPVAPSVTSTEEYQDAIDDDDIEVLSATNEASDEEDDGFVTDEEYDILDASDEETVA